MVSKTYGQYCPIAEALDLVGDRWTLLIARELSWGPRRFTDLRDALTGIAPNLLSDRLRDLEAGGIVERQELPPPAARTVYALTAEGKELRPVLLALARFGAPRLPAPDHHTTVTPRAALVSAFTAFHDPLACTGWDEHYRFVIDGSPFDVRTANGRVRTPAPGSEPVLTIEAAATTLVGIRQGRTTLDRAVADGAVTVAGPKRALAHLKATFGLPPK